MSGTAKFFIYLIGGFVLLLILIAISPFTIIDAGHRGVVKNWGAVSEEILGEGIHWVTPIKQDVVEFDVRTQKEQVEAGAASKDLQTVNATVALNYHLEGGKVNRLLQETDDYKTTIIAPAIQESVKAAAAKYTAEELVTKRALVKEDARVLLVERLAPKHIVLDDLSIVNFSFSKSFDEAIEAKVTAEQQALAAKNKLEQVKFEAEQRVAQARAEAEAIRIQAQAITQQGGEDYVQLKAIEKWNGVLPGQMIPGSTVPFLNLTR